MFLLLLKESIPALLPQLPAFSDSLNKKKKRICLT